jgi:two-component system KDP operon response regulator KdpE
MSAKPVRILVVDNDPAMRRALRTSLISQGYCIREARTGEEAIQEVTEHPADLILLDIEMPGIGGLEACRRLRSIASQAGIVMLTVCDAEEDMVRALEAGADDYVTKPFSINELLARVRAALRRTHIDEQSDTLVIDVGDFHIDIPGRRVEVRSQEVRLTPKEFDVLVYLARHPDKVITHRALLSAVWGPSSLEQTEYLRVCIGHLRKKLEPDEAASRYIVTEPWVGYRFEPGL